MSSDQEQMSYKIVVGEGFCRVEGSPFLEAEKTTMGSLQLIGGGGGGDGRSTDPAIRPIVEAGSGVTSQSSHNVC